MASMAAYTLYPSYCGKLKSRRSSAMTSLRRGGCKRQQTGWGAQAVPKSWRTGVLQLWEGEDERGQELLEVWSWSKPGGTPLGLNSWWLQGLSFQAWQQNHSCRLASAQFQSFVIKLSSSKGAVVMGGWLFKSSSYFLEGQTY